MSALALAAHPGVTLHLEKSTREIVLLDDHGARIARLRADRSARIVTTDGSEDSTGSPAKIGFSGQRILEGGGIDAVKIASRPGSHRATQADATIASFAYPIFPWRSAVTEEMRRDGPDGKRIAYVTAAGLGVRIAFEPATSERDRRLALWLYIGAMLSRVPPPSHVRYLIPRAL